MGSQFWPDIRKWQSSQGFGKAFLFLTNKKDTAMAAIFSPMPQHPVSNEDEAQQLI